MPWPTLLASRLAHLGWTPSDLAARLTRAGWALTRQAVEGWLRGSRPEPHRWAAVFDALALADRDRGAWVEALMAPPESGVRS